MVFDIWVGCSRGKNITDVWARLRTPLNRAALLPAALIRMTADISATGAMKAAEHWFKGATNPAAGQPARLMVTPTIYVNVAGKDGNILVILKDE